jgi:lysyl-tRNA synthetase class 2
MTNSASIQDVLLFPQMKPEKKQQVLIDEPSKFTEIGIPTEWVEVLQKLGYTTVAKIKEVDKPGKLHQEMMGYRKKNKLEIGTLSVQDIEAWII